MLSNDVGVGEDQEESRGEDSRGHRGGEIREVGSRRARPCRCK